MAGGRPRRAVGAVVGLLVLLLGARGGAEPRLYVVDPERSQIRFHAVSRLMDADGAFGRFSGEVRLDAGRPETAAGRLTIEVASIDTGIRVRDSHLRSDDFFDVERYPRATFVIAAVRREGERWVVGGQLTIHGVTRTVAVPVTVTASERSIRVAGELTLNRREFGINYSSRLNPIRDEVRVWFDLSVVPR